MKKPKVVERFADNGEHSHYDLIDEETGNILWSDEVKNTKQQTAVEWQSIMFKTLLMRLHFMSDMKFSEIADQIEAFESKAKEMERDQIDEAFIEGRSWDSEYQDSQEYYEETYGGKKK